MRKSKCVHHHIIDYEGNGVCKKCGEISKHATPTTIERIVSKSQITKGQQEISLYKKQLQNYEVY
jgi:hypothetical protein